MSRIIVGVCFLLLISCQPVPSDPDETLTRIRESSELRIGTVTGSNQSSIRSVISRLEQATGASAETREGEAELLLADLEQGKLDLVFGAFAKSSPWKRNVWLSSATEGGKPAKDAPVLRAAARNGENGWIMMIERTVRQQ